MTIKYDNQDKEWVNALLMKKESIQKVGLKNINLIIGDIKECWIS